MPEPKPDFASIGLLETHFNEVWGNAFGQWRLDDDMYWQRYVVWPQETERDSYHPAKSTELVDHAVDNLLSYTARFHRFVTGPEEIHQERADRIEKFLVALFEDTGNFETELPFKLIGKYLTHYGRGCLDGPQLDLRDRPEPGRRHAHWNPFRFYAAHPSQVLMSPTEKNPDRAIRRLYLSSEQLARLTEKKAKRKDVEVDIQSVGTRPYTSILVRDYWSRDWHALCGPTTMYYVEKNHWNGVQPMKQAYSGFGMLPGNTERVDPAFLAVGIGRASREEQVALAQAMSAVHNNITKHGYPQEGTRLDPNEYAEAQAQDKILQGEKDDYWVQEVPTLPRHLFQHISNLLQGIEGGSYSSVAAGRRPAGVSTVGQQAILSSSSGKKFINLVRQLESLASLLAADVLRMIVAMGRPITIHGITVSPEDIENDYSVKAQFELVDPVVALQNRQIGASEVLQGLKSLETYWDADLKLEDVSGERIRMLEDKIRADPQVSQILAAAVVAGLGLPSVPGVNGNGTTPASGLIDSRGQPLASTLGASTANPAPPGSPQENIQAGEQMRRGLTPEVLSPSRAGQNRAGGI